MSDKDSSLYDRMSKEFGQNIGAKVSAAGMSAIGIVPTYIDKGSFLVKPVTKVLPAATIIGAGLTGKDAGSEARRAYEESFNEDKIQNATAAGIGSLAQSLTFGVVDGRSIEDKLSSSKHLDKLMEEVNKIQSNN